MQELGEESEKYHKEIFNLINNSDIKKCLFICDKKSEKIRKYFSLFGRAWGKSQKS